MASVIPMVELSVRSLPVATTCSADATTLGPVGVTGGVSKYGLSGLTIAGSSPVKGVAFRFPA